MSLKFGKNREVTTGYCKIPLYYTGLIHPKNKDKELVIMDRLGDNYTVCWKNNRLCKTGIEFLVRAVEGGFYFKDKIYNLGNKVI